MQEWIERFVSPYPQETKIISIFAPDFVSFPEVYNPVKANELC